MTVSGRTEATLDHRCSQADEHHPRTPEVVFIFYASSPSSLSPGEDLRRMVIRIDSVLLKIMTDRRRSRRRTASITPEMGGSSISSSSSSSSRASDRHQCQRTFDSQSLACGHNRSVFLFRLSLLEMYLECDDICKSDFSLPLASP